MVSMSAHYLRSLHHMSCLRFEVYRDGDFLLIFPTDIDEEGGSVYDNFEAAEIRRKETLEYLRCCLDSKKPEAYTKPTSPLVLSFKPIGDSLRKGFTTGKHRRADGSNGGLC